uniref:Uncharacterized protein n=1 Tax=Rhizophora mucronata TaxID=61149 RepID=A0A2P2QKU3_RHIMU
MAWGGLSDCKKYCLWKSYWLKKDMSCRSFHLG